MKHKITVSPLSREYDFVTEVYFTYAKNRRQAIFNIVMREPSVRSLVSKDLCEITAECLETTVSSFEEFLDKNWEEIQLHERNMYAE